jgi:hypothetical protein
MIDAQRFGERRARTALEDGMALMARPFHLELGRTWPQVFMYRRIDQLYCVIRF